MKDVDRPPHVEPFSEPAGRQRVGADSHTVRTVRRSQRIQRIAGHRPRIGDIGHEPAVGPTESQRAVGVPLDPVPNSTGENPVLYFDVSTRFL